MTEGSDHSMDSAEAPGFQELLANNNARMDQQEENMLNTGRAVQALVAQWDMFLHGLADRIQQEIYTVELPTGLDELVDLALRVDARLQQRDLRGRRKCTPEYPSLDTGDTVSHSSVDEPMQVGRARLSREERARRRMRGLCLYCGRLAISWRAAQ